MKSFDTDLKKYSEKINLKLSERHELRERILSYMEYHPLPKQRFESAQLSKEIQTESFIMLHFTPRVLKFGGAFLVLCLMVIPFIAERSVPGDVLYLVKTGLNENVQEQFANSSYKKIEFETKLMERRISEARILASEGKLTEETKTQLAETVKEHAQAVRTQLGALRTTDADGAAIAEIVFDSALAVQSTVLEANAGDNENNSLISTIRTVVDDARDEVALNQASNTPSYDGLLARVELQTTRAYELFTGVKETATAEEAQDIERRLSDIDRLFAEAKDQKVTDETVAVNDLTNVLSLTQKLIVFMTNIDIRNAVSLESLVPVVLSTEERTKNVETAIQSLTGLEHEIDARIKLVLDPELLAKIHVGRTQVDGLMNKTTAALQAADIGTAEASVKELQAIMSDLDTLTQEFKISEILPDTSSTTPNTLGTTTPVIPASTTPPAENSN